MRIDLKNTVITLKGGDSEELIIKLGDGNLTFRATKNREYFLDRGILDSVRDGDEVPVEITMDCVWEELQGSAGSTAATPTPYDVFQHEGGAVDWVTSATDTCEPFAVDIELVHTPDCTTFAAETILFADFRYESIDGDPKAGTLSVSGKCNITKPTIT